jgi:hypothetical protein
MQSVIMLSGGKLVSDTVNEMNVTACHNLKLILRSSLFNIKQFIRYNYV